MIGWGRLKAAGVLGMNRRNADFILRHNPRRHYPLVDDKLRTKRLAQAAGIAVPDLYGVIEIEHDIARLPEIVRDRRDFVIKPAQGSGGNGIVVITGRHNQRYRLSNDSLMTEDELEHHISNILNGMYSLGGQADKALIEYRVKFDPLFEQVSYRGVPDIRTIVFRGVPVAAMVRLPTRDSDGKANLHQGAVGAGIDMASGCTARAVCQNRLVTQHPDTGAEIAGLQIPQWEQLLTLAARCHELVGLGYLGVDVVLDRERGPLVLELNARPGLAIQIANGAGLRQRLDRIDGLHEIPADPAARARLAREWFGAARGVGM
ncbi:MAG: alpha-L-glutamate ligase-like protein [Nevskiales bacterium]